MYPAPFPRAFKANVFSNTESICRHCIDHLYFGRTIVILVSQAGMVILSRLFHVA